MKEFVGEIKEFSGLNKTPLNWPAVDETFALDIPIFQDEPAARAAMEALRWPNGPTCPHCGEKDRNFQILGAKQSHRTGLRHCKSCRKQFTVTVGTVFVRTRVSYVNWMRLAYLLSRTDDHCVSVPEVTEALSVPYKTALRMLDRVADALITYKGELSRQKFGKPVTHYITKKARPLQPRLRHPQHPSNPRDQAYVGQRYRAWKQRLKLDKTTTPEPRGVLAALSGLSSSRELDRIERLLLVLLQADPKKVKAAGRLRNGWEIHRSRLYEARVRRPNRKPAPTVQGTSGR